MGLRVQGFAEGGVALCCDEVGLTLACKLALKCGEGACGDAEVIEVLVDTLHVLATRPGRT